MSRSGNKTNCLPTANKPQRVELIWEREPYYGNIREEADSFFFRGAETADQSCELNVRYVGTDS